MLSVAVDEVAIYWH